MGARSALPKQSSLRISKTRIPKTPQLLTLSLLACDLAWCCRRSYTLLCACELACGLLTGRLQGTVPGSKKIVGIFLA